MSLILSVFWIPWDTNTVHSLKDERYHLTYEYNLICIITIKASVEMTVNAIEDYNFVGRNWSTIIKFSWRNVSKCWALSEVWINVRGLRLKPTFEKNFIIDRVLNLPLSNS